MNSKSNRLQFRYTYTCSSRDGQIITQDTGLISGYTPKAVKHVVVRRFHLQAWSPWTRLPNGNYKRSHHCAHTGERSTMVLEAIPQS